MKCNNCSISANKENQHLRSSFKKYFLVRPKACQFKINTLKLHFLAPVQKNPGIILKKTKGISHIRKTSIRPQTSVSTKQPQTVNVQQRKRDRHRKDKKNMDSNPHKCCHGLSIMRSGRMYIIQQQEHLGETPVVSRRIQWR
jgi:hypothetical protein